MPFLILALIGVDKYFKNKNTLILSLSVLLIILMSFYYSISSIFCIAVYWIYKYISYNEKIQFKSFMKAGLKFLIPVMIGILLSSILIVPEFYAITVGRMKVASDISLWKLITPNINISYIAFYSYGVGLTSLVLISLVTLLFNKNKEHKFLSIILSLFVLFPLFNCVLNGFMYIDAKILIPFLPLYVLSIAIFIDNFYNHKIELNKTIIAVLLITALSFIEGTYRYIYLIYEIILTLAVIALCYKKRYYKLFNVYTVIVLMFLSLTINSTDKLILKDDNIYKNDIYQEKLVDYITESDKNIYRITTLVDKKHTSNTTFSNIDMYQDVMYSSLYNEEYNKFYYDVFNNQVQSRNRILTTPSANILFLMFMGNKYLLSENDSVIGYNLYKTENNIKAYYNNDVLPFMYVS